MPSKDQEKPENQASQSAKAAGPASDTNELLETLNQVFSTFQIRLQNQAPKPFDGPAEQAVNAFNEIVAGLQLKAPPDPPKLEAKAVSSAEVELRWKQDASDIVGFRLRRCQGQNCEDFTEIKQLPAGERSVRDAGLSGGTTYRYQLAAFNARGEALSNIADVTTGR